MGGNRQGIDVSAHQGLIRWNEVCADFAILRAGWSWYEGGMNIDQRFLENVSGVQDEGIPWGVYLYAYDKTPAAAVKSADRLADLLDKYQIPYPVAYDFEDSQYLSTGRKANTAICAAFLERLQERGYYAMLYTYTNFAQGYLDMESLASYDLWIADYTGKVDLNIAYKDYPAIIQAAGLNGFGSHQGGGEDCAALRQAVETLEREKATLETEKAALTAKIIAAKAALG